ncbi:hypothetical protein SeMB42_g01886 [Synchytrium endobioticum]|uniref:Alcohol dehydrogenase-like C-terminal domain-containing protein n=1 Tax=Synchytrium endobioticum TaxID=286115 RepID=A0A507DJV9_9FUNG|nr:hypothetical protein SeMB42_g01886 [Synchytrium endobioticum]
MERVFGSKDGTDVWAEEIAVPGSMALRLHRVPKNLTLGECLAVTSSYPTSFVALTASCGRFGVLFLKLVEPSIAWNGRIVVVGFTGGAIESVPTNRLLLKNASVVGIHLGDYSVHQPEIPEQAWKEIFKILESEKLGAKLLSNMRKLQTIQLDYERAM